ncbi:MAG: hypothetical protein KatS3mg111_0136 [Pirellulaceae bacterium]|nr:MAG: hypothetical protein KatS3mg111_0136 [Pirellulaceae bacterium]
MPRPLVTSHDSSHGDSPTRYRGLSSLKIGKLPWTTPNFSPQHQHFAAHCMDGSRRLLVQGNWIARSAPNSLSIAEGSSTCLLALTYQPTQLFVQTVTNTPHVAESQPTWDLSNLMGAARKDPIPNGLVDCAFTGGGRNVARCGKETDSPEATTIAQLGDLPPIELLGSSTVRRRGGGGGVDGKDELAVVATRKVVPGGGGDCFCSGVD